MNALYDLREMLCKQLEDYGKKGELTAAVLERVDMLAHAVKNIDKIIEVYESEGEYSEYDGDDMTSRRSYDGGSMREGERSRNRRSMARRRDSMGRYSRGYSRHGDLAEQIRDLMEDAPDEKTRQEMQRLVSRLDNM